MASVETHFSIGSQMHRHFFWSFFPIIRCVEKKGENTTTTHTRRTWAALLMATPAQLMESSILDATGGKYAQARPFGLGLATVYTSPSRHKRRETGR